MRAAPLRWLAWLLVVVVAYGLYQRLADSTSEQDLAALNKETGDAEQRLARLREHTEQANRQIDATIGKAESYHADQVARATFINDIASVSMLKLVMVECYHNDGEWPIDGCGIDLAEMRGELLRQVTVEPDGVIQMAFQAGRGLPEISVRLQPELQKRGIQWLCTSADYAQISELLPDCHFQTGSYAQDNAAGR